VVGGLIAIVFLAACGSSAKSIVAPTTPKVTHSASATPSESTSQQKASGDAARKLAQDNKARQAFEDKWSAINFDDTSTLGSQLTDMAKYVATLNASPALKDAMRTLVGDTVAFYFATKNVPTQEQIQRDADAVKNTV